MIRIRLKRTKGWHLPEDTIYVGRPTKWGNPYQVGIALSHEEVLIKYQDWLEEKLQEDKNFLKDLKGKNLACWCPLNVRCHADILIEKLEPSVPQGVKLDARS